MSVLTVLAIQKVSILSSNAFPITRLLLCDDAEYVNWVFNILLFSICSLFVYLVSEGTVSTVIKSSFLMKNKLLIKGHSLPPDLDDSGVTSMNSRRILSHLIGDLNTNWYCLFGHVGVPTNNVFIWSSSEPLLLYIFNFLGNPWKTWEPLE